MKNNGLKNSKAITLIAMVVTIIVLLILAGVSIAVLIGENGLLNRATTAKQTNEQKTAEEELKLAVSALSIDYRKNTTNSQTFREFVTSESGAKLKIAMGLDTNNQELKVENATNGVVSYKGQKYQVDDYGGVAEYVPMWIQNKTEVTKDGVTLEVGQAVTEYSVTATIGEEEKTISNWYVLGAENGKLLITTNTNPEKITLEGKTGYTEGVIILNSVVSKYTNLSLAAGNARSINVEDINRVTGYNPDIVRYNEGTTNVNQWNNEVTYTLENDEIYCKGTKYPQYSEDELGKRTYSSSFEYWDGKNWIKLGEGINPKYNVTIKNTSYGYNPLDTTSEIFAGVENSSDAYNLLFNKTGNYANGEGAYILATFAVSTVGDANAPSYVQFGPHHIFNGFVYGGWDLVTSSGGGRALQNIGIRPVVELKSEVNVLTTGEILQ